MVVRLKIEETNNNIYLWCEGQIIASEEFEVKKEVNRILNSSIPKVIVERVYINE